MTDREQEYLIREAVRAALAALDGHLPDARKASGPLGDKLAGALDDAVRAAVAEYVREKATA